MKEHLTYKFWAAFFFMTFSASMVALVRNDYSNAVIEGLSAISGLLTGFMFIFSVLCFFESLMINHSVAGTIVGGKKSGHSYDASAADVEQGG